MADLHNIPKCIPKTIGILPSSYALSLSYEEQIIDISKKTNEIINFINDVLVQKINDYIQTKFNDMIINALYEPSTETLVLYLDTTN